MERDMSESYAAALMRGIEREKARNEAGHSPQAEAKACKSPASTAAENHVYHVCTGCHVTFVCGGSRPGHDSRFCCCEQLVQSLNSDSGALRLCYYHSLDCLELTNECGAYLSDSDDEMYNRF